VQSKFLDLIHFAQNSTMKILVVSVLLLFVQQAYGFDPALIAAAASGMSNGLLELRKYLTTITASSSTPAGVYDLSSNFARFEATVSEEHRQVKVDKMIQYLKLERTVGSPFQSLLAFANAEQRESLKSHLEDYAEFLLDTNFSTIDCNVRDCSNTHYSEQTFQIGMSDLNGNFHWTMIHLKPSTVNSKYVTIRSTSGKTSWQVKKSIIIMTQVYSESDFFGSSSSTTTDFREIDVGQNDQTLLRVMYMLGSVSQILSGTMNVTAPQDSNPKFIEWKAGQESAKQVQDFYQKQVENYEASVQKDIDHTHKQQLKQMEQQTERLPNSDQKSSNKEKA
jgi:hypothetical protein